MEVRWFTVDLVHRAGRLGLDLDCHVAKLTGIHAGDSEAQGLGGG